MGIGQFYLTDKGANLLAKAQIGGEISYTKAKIGDGFVPDGTAITSLTDLVKPLKNLNLIELSISQKQAIVEIEFTNQGLAPFWWMEIGLFATDPDEGEILYAYGNAGTQEKADYINGVLTEFKFNMIMPIQNATNVTAVINESLVYPSKEELTGHINNKNNPHGITKVELGLENVQNTADIDKVMSNPTRTYVGDKATLTTTAKTNLVQAINEVNQSASGASGAVNAHVANKSNPHVVTKAQLGLENVANAEQATKTEFNAHNADMVKHITAGERTAWNGKADNSSVTTFNGTATKAGNMVNITVSNNGKTDYTVTFTAPSNFNAPDMYRINGTAVTLTDLNNKPLKNAWVQGSAVTLSVVGAKAFFKTGGEFSSGDLLPTSRVEAVYDTSNTSAVASVKYVSGHSLDNYRNDYYTAGSYYSSTVYHLNDYFSSYIKFISLPSIPQSYKCVLVTKDFVLVYGGSNALCWVVLDRNLQVIVTKTFSGYTFSLDSITECNGYIYVISGNAPTTKLIKLDYALNIISEISISNVRFNSGITSFENNIYLINNDKKIIKYNVVTLESIFLNTSLRNSGGKLKNKSRYATFWTYSPFEYGLVNLDTDCETTYKKESFASFSSGGAYCDDIYLYVLYSEGRMYISDLFGNNGKYTSFFIINESNSSPSNSMSSIRMGFPNFLGHIPISVPGMSSSSEITALRLDGLAGYKIIEE